MNDHKDLHQTLESFSDDNAEVKSGLVIHFEDNGNTDQNLQKFDNICLFYNNQGKGNNSINDNSYTSKEVTKCFDNSESECDSEMTENTDGTIEKTGSQSSEDCQSVCDPMEESTDDQSVTISNIFEVKFCSFQVHVFIYILMY